MLSNDKYVKASEPTIVDGNVPNQTYSWIIAYWKIIATLPAILPQLPKSISVTWPLLTLTPNQLEIEYVELGSPFVLHDHAFTEVAHKLTLIADINEHKISGHAWMPPSWDTTLLRFVKVKQLG